MSELSVYVHFPWCLAKCPYCDFASAAATRDRIPDGTYADAVLSELDARSPLLAAARVPTVFFGGGTPSLWSSRSIGRVLSAVTGLDGPPDEVTVECNPSSLDERTAAGLLEAGATRLSVGLQSLRDEHLKFLGRLHDAARALRALGDARRAGVRRLNADLIYGLPGQRADALAGDVRRVVDTGVTHVSAYALTIEPGTPFGMLHGEGRLPVAPDDDYAACHEAVERTLEAAGFVHYEVSNYARPGEEARHNLHTWRGGDSLGLGAGAVSTVRGKRHRNVGDGARYLDAALHLARGAPPRTGDGVVVEHEALTIATRVSEAWLLGLRLAEGLDLAATARRLGADPRAGRELEIERLERAGDLVLEGERARVPKDRWLVLDRVLRRLV